MLLVFKSLMYNYWAHKTKKQTMKPARGPETAKEASKASKQCKQAKQASKVRERGPKPSKLSKLSKPRRLHYLKSAPGAAKFPPKK